MKLNVSKYLVVSVSIWAISTLLICIRFLWIELDKIPNRYIDDFHHYEEGKFGEPVVLQWTYFQKLLEEIEQIDIQNIYLSLGYIVTSTLLLVVAFAYLRVRNKMDIETSQHDS